MTNKFSPVAPLFQIDAYKLGHHDMYRASGNVTKVYSNFTNRKSRLEGVDKVVHFGLQAFIQKYLVDSFVPFFDADRDEVCALYSERCAQILGGDASDYNSEHIGKLHDMGYLPLSIHAVKEGTRVPFNVPSFTIENTHPDFFWLPNYIESLVSASVWHPSTTATIAYRLRELMNGFAEKTSDNLGAVAFQGHDFSFRGQASPESAAASGAGHLLSFSGSDSLISMDWVDDYYQGDNGAYLGSVPATEHSVMSMGIALNGEKETFRRLLDTYPKGILSIVSDTFDLWKVLTEFLPELKDEILAREGKLVIRPDSGKPVDILCGDASAPEGTPARKGVLELLWETFGGTVNSKGYRVLDEHIGAIYGDSINYESAKEICERMVSIGFDTTNVVLGIGSYVYQFVTRDTFNSAMKATYAEANGKSFDLFKNPVTGDGMKRSATGRLAVLKDAEGNLTLKERASDEDLAQSELQETWRDGKFIRYQSFADVRETLANN